MPRQNQWFLLAVFPILLLSAHALALTDKSDRQQPKQLHSAPQKHSLLTDVFQSQFKPEELKALGSSPSLERLVGNMSPKQKKAAGTHLKSLEATTKDPKVLEDISQGYQLLGKHHDTLRVGTTLQRLKPKDSRGFSISANASLELKNYEDAVIHAEEALKRNPNDKVAFVALMLSKGRVSQDSSRTNPIPGRRPAVSQTEPSPRAMALMKQAIAARQSGDMDKTWILVQDAMRADPTSSVVQDFYRLAHDDYSKVSDTRKFFTLSQEAMAAGRGKEAVKWAEKAVARSNDSRAIEILELARQQAQKLAKSAFKPVKEPEKAPTDDRGFPLWPVYTMVGLGALGYGVSRSMGTWKEQESEQQEEPTFDSPEAQTAYYEAQKKKYEGYQTVAKHARNGAMVFLFVGGGILAWQVAAPLVGPYVAPIVVKIKEPALRVYNRLTQAFPRLRSQAGSINPKKAQDAASIATNGSRLIPGFSAVESQVINEAQQILSSSQFTQLHVAFKAGKPAVVKIGGRVIQYDPNWPYSGMTNFKERSFIIGRAAFKSAQELQKTVLTELYRLSTSQIARGADAELIKQETRAAYSFADRAVGVLYK